MTKRERIEASKTIREAFSLINKKNFARFCGVFMWAQVHHQNNYFIDETGSRRLFIDDAIKLYLNPKRSFKLEYQKEIMGNYLLYRIKPEQERVVFLMLKAAALGKETKDIWDIVRERDDYYY